ncbi:hypothetical protein X798_07827 [Onchocerca flexuosa]|uniref:Protein quiver n=2 Tax=Onchocerca flexuosa TaxID=387005 RepID=A0A183HYN2_9BILA|nr:hypothetical protein X798_07827 [Onchocerca flexuosa]VDP11693.1 unnamed protein product [Onchocerca flexuosa]
MKIVFYLVIFTSTMAFKCFQCNNGVDEDDTKPCFDQETKCPKNAESCSTILYVAQQNDKMHMRKFCTTPDTSVSQYLRLFPSSVMCQNIFMNQEHVQHMTLMERRRREELPPAPPRQYKNNLLCISATSLCNGSIHREVIDRIMLNSTRHNVDIDSSLQDLDN